MLETFVAGSTGASSALPVIFYLACIGIYAMRDGVTV